MPVDPQVHRFQSPELGPFRMWRRFPQRLGGMVESSQVDAVDVASPSPLQSISSNFSSRVDEAVLAEFLRGPGPAVSGEPIASTLRCAERLQGVSSLAADEIQQHDEECCADSRQRGDPLFVPVANRQGDVRHRGAAVWGPVTRRIQKFEGWRST